MNDDTKKDESEKKEEEKPDKEPCMRCGAPVEYEGDMICRKCEGEVH